MTFQATIEQQQPHIQQYYSGGKGKLSRFALRPKDVENFEGLKNGLTAPRSNGNTRRTFLACYFYWPIMRMREKPRAAIRCYCLPLVHSSTTTISQYAKMKIFCLAHYSKANYIIQFMKLEWSVCAPFSPQLTHFSMLFGSIYYTLDAIIQLTFSTRFYC